MPETKTISSIERERAKFAYGCVEQISSSNFSKEYRAYVKNIPMMIMTNGLCAAFAFVFSKAESNKAYQQIYHQTGEWLRKEPRVLIRMPENGKLIDEMLKLESAEYRAVTFEVLALFNWLRRFADGLIEGDE